MAKSKGARKGYAGGGSNNNVNGKAGMGKAMSARSPLKPQRVVPAPSMAATLGGGSRKGS